MIHGLRRPALLSARPSIFRQKDRNPNDLSIGFKIVGGAKFIPDEKGWKREE